MCTHSKNLGWDFSEKKSFFYTTIRISLFQSVRVQECKYTGCWQTRQKGQRNNNKKVENSKIRDLLHTLFLLYNNVVYNNLMLSASLKVSGFCREKRIKDPYYLQPASSPSNIQSPFLLFFCIIYSYSGLQVLFTI